MNFKSIKKAIENPEQSRLCDSVLSRIESEGITPCPRWQFWCRYSGIWSLWLVSVLLGAVSVAVVLYVTEHARFYPHEATHETSWSFVFDVIPYLWIVALVLMVVSAYYNFRSTKRGYRYSLWQVIVSSITFSVLVGVFLHWLGFGYQVDTYLGRGMDTYPSMERMEMKLWQMPTEGRLIGSYKAMSSDNMFYLVADARDDLWRVDVTELSEADLSLLSSGKSVRLLGTTTNSLEKDFHACGVFPWMFDERHTAVELAHERQAFVRQMYDHMEVGDRLKALEEEIYEAETYGKPFMEGRCADIATVRRMKFE